METVIREFKDIIRSKKYHLVSTPARYNSSKVRRMQRLEKGKYKVYCYDERVWSQQIKHCVQDKHREADRQAPTNGKIAAVTQFNDISKRLRRYAI